MKLKAFNSEPKKTMNGTTKSYLIDSRYVLNAGAITKNLDMDQQACIDAVFISHSHLDYICDLPYLIENSFSMRSTPLKIYASQLVLKAIKDHIFNDIMWPDFTQMSIPNTNTPCVELVELSSDVPVKCDEYVVLPVEASHTPGSFSFVFMKDDKSILFNIDSNPNDSFRNLLEKFENLQAVVMKVSMPIEIILKEVSELKLNADLYLDVAAKLKKSEIENLAAQLKEYKKSKEIVILEDKSVVML